MMLITHTRLSFWLSTFVAVTALALPTRRASADNYPRAAQPLVPATYTPLAPGAVEPAGWLRDWALAARDGITGHLDEWHPTFGGGWSGTQLKAPHSRPDGTGWPLEQCSYWLDGAVRLGYILHDDALITKVTSRLQHIVDGVSKGGKTFIHWRDEPPQGFNSWACSHMGRALVAWYEATGDKRILDALVQAYLAYPADLGPLNYEDVSGLCNIDAMLETYSFSGERRLLEKARAAISTPEAEGTLKTWLDGKIESGHGVIQYEQFRLPMLFYPWSGDARHRQASLAATRWLQDGHMLPYGALSGMEYVAGVGAFRLTETCDVAAQLWTDIWFYRILGESTCGDRIEQTFFNAGAAPIARDFQTMCYYQSPNRIQAESLPEEQPNAPGKGCLKFTQLGYPHVLCCVGAVNRIIPSYVGHMWMATSDNGLAAALYGPCTVKALAGPKIPVKLTCETAYPFEETIRITVDPERPAEFPLYFRIPQWCARARIAVNDKDVPATTDTHGRVAVQRRWEQGDRITLVFPMSVKVQRGMENEYPISARKYFNFKPDADFQPRRLPFASVSYGPLLFALPLTDQGPNQVAPDARWQFALDLDARLKGSDVKVHRQAMPAKWDWPLDAPIVLQAAAKTFDWKPTDLQPLPAAVVEGTSAETIRLIPYGCTRFRISMFPVTAQAWKE